MRRFIDILHEEFEHIFFYGILLPYVVTFGIIGGTAPHFVDSPYLMSIKSLDVGFMLVVVGMTSIMLCAAFCNAIWRYFHQN